jgi:hypothetical protein
MITEADIKRMGYLECDDIRQRLLKAKNPNMNLVDACDERLSALDRNKAMAENGEIKPGEFQ